MSAKMQKEVSRLKEIIVRRVFKTEEISLISEGKKQWIFDFKSISMDREFMSLYANIFWDRFKNQNIQVGGMESGALPLVAAVSFCRDDNEAKVNTFYIRKSRKKSDLANLVEGNLDTSVPIVLVDDVLSSGGTFIKQVTILEEQGYKVKAIFVAIRYRDLDYYKYFKDKNIEVHSIFELNDFKESLNIKNITDDIIKPVIWDKYKKVWSVKLSRPSLYHVVPKSGPVCDDNFIYIGSDDGGFRCVDKINGEIAWTYYIPFGAEGKKIFSTPVTDDNNVYFGAYDGNFYCLDKKTGNIVWVNYDADWIGSSPCLSGDGKYVYAGLEFGLFKKRGGVICVDAKNGKKIWTYYEMQGLTHASPAYNAKHNLVICGCNDGYIYALEGDNGKLKWKYKTGGEVKYGAIFDNERNLVLIGSMDGGLYALDLYEGKLYHRFEALFGFYSTPVIYHNLVIIGSLDKNVYAYNLDTKSVAWKHATLGRIFSSPVIFDELVYIGSNDGRLYEIDAKNGKNISITQFTERIVNRVIVEKDKKGERFIIVSTHDCGLTKIAKD